MYTTSNEGDVVYNLLDSLLEKWVGFTYDCTRTNSDGVSKLIQRV